MTVGVAMVISAINALTLVARACAASCSAASRTRRRGIDRRVSCAASTGSATAMAAVVERLVRVSSHRLDPASPCSAAGIVGCRSLTPTGFLPEEDQGAFFVVGAVAGRVPRVARTSETSPAGRGRPQGRCRRSPTFTAVIGFSTS